jgi:hypothetical protein
MNRHIHKWTLAVVLLSLAAARGLAQEARPAPTLHLLSIGVSRHQFINHSGGVHYAAKDARDLADLLKRQEGRLFARVECHTLINEDATLPRITDAMARISARARNRDYVMIYLSGHGGSHPKTGDYLYENYDFLPRDPRTHLTGKTIWGWLQRTPGIGFLVLDTCQAALAVPHHDVSFVTLASCLSDESSSETALLQQGFFTRALLEGLRGQADANHDGIVTLAELDAYIADRVHLLTRGKQKTTMVHPNYVESRLPLIHVVGQQGIAASGPTSPLAALVAAVPNRPTAGRPGSGQYR